MWDILTMDDIKYSPHKSTPSGEIRICCPFCGDKKYHMYVNLEKGVYNCFLCGAKGKIKDRDNINEGISMRRISNQEEEKEIKSKRNRLLKHIIYSELLNRLELSEAHLKHLKEERGLPEGYIIQRRYRTAPLPENTMHIACSIASRYEINNIPGFFKNGRFWDITSYKGIYIPLEDFDGTIQGIQVRLDEAVDGAKYLWFSSAGKNQGAKAEVTYHVAGYKEGVKKVWITEGPLKADICYAKTGETFIAVPGVHSWKSCNIIEELKKREIGEVIIAYDADSITNDHVTNAVINLYNNLAKADIRVNVAYWLIEDGKGIDDYVSNKGRLPEVVDMVTYMKKVKFEKVRRGLLNKYGSINNLVLSGFITKINEVIKNNRKYLLLKMKYVYNNIETYIVVLTQGDKRNLLDRKVNIKGRLATTKGETIYVVAEEIEVI
ncbi:MAG: DUF3854 domain-containing protein [Thermovenabulum sp.]|uniref:DUF3854 domain-containing protein n=1 Tax=Thermovenabulum sp. TaxID=3100335 RepID=UPI003C7A4962